MGSVRQEIIVGCRPEQVWSAVRDVGAVHRRLLPGRVPDAVIEGDVRTLLMPDGHRVVELILDVDDDARRFAYCVISGARPTLRHHSASFQVLPVGDQQARLVWVTDFLPNDAAGWIRARMERGAADMKDVLERTTPDEGDGPASTSNPSPGVADRTERR
jgi:Polyketide cyclase / dehydrase and lipid transport